jgi:hypothetical protein
MAARVIIVNDVHIVEEPFALPLHHHGDYEVVGHYPYCLIPNEAFSRDKSYFFLKPITAI